MGFKTQNLFFCKNLSPSSPLFSCFPLSFFFLPSGTINRQPNHHRSLAIDQLPSPSLSPFWTAISDGCFIRSNPPLPRDLHVSLFLDLNHIPVETRRASSPSISLGLPPSTLTAACPVAYRKIVVGKLSPCSWFRSCIKIMFNYYFVTCKTKIMYI